jgi:cellulose synthase operon protein C
LNLRPRTFLAAGIAVGLAFNIGCDREREEVLKNLNSPHPEVRAQAVSRLAGMTREEDLPLFIKRATDPAPLVRKAAAEALGQQTDLRAIDLLGDLLADGDEDVQSAAAASLARFKSDKAHAHLLSAYARRGPETRAAIARALGAKGTADAIRHEADHLWEVNLKVLEQGSPPERVGAAEELGRSGRPEAVDKLMPILSSDLVLLAAAAARGLGYAGDRRATLPIMDLLKESHSMLREAAAEALGALGDPQATAALAKAALDAGPSAGAAVDALGRMPVNSVEVKNALCEVASHSGSTETAAQAARLAKARGGCSTEGILTRLAQGGADSRASLAALGGLGPGAAGADRVIALLDSSDNATRIAAARALGELEVEKARPALAKVIRTEGERIGNARAKWIKDPLPATFAPGFEKPEPGSHASNGKDGKTLQDLMEMVKKNDEARAVKMGVTLHDPSDGPPTELIDDLAPDDTDLLAAALTAYARVKAPEAAGVLAAYVTDPDIDVRTAALTGLALTGTPEAVITASKGLDDPNPDVVDAVAGALGKAGEPGVKALIEGLSRRRSGRAAMARALGQAHASPAAKALTTLLPAGGAEAIEAAVALGVLADRSTAPALVNHLRDPRAVGRQEAIEALGAIGDPATAETILTELFHDRPEIRGAAARALGRLEARSDLPYIESVRQDYYAEVRRGADWAVEHLSGGSGTPAPGSTPQATPTPSSPPTPHD